MASITVFALWFGFRRDRHYGRVAFMRRRVPSLRSLAHAAKAAETAGERRLHVDALGAADGLVALEGLALVLEAEERADGAAAEGVREHPVRVPQHEAAGCGRDAAGMCRTFIHRSARHRMNSISSADRCSVRTTAVVPS